MNRPRARPLVAFALGGLALFASASVPHPSHGRGVTPRAGETIRYSAVWSWEGIDRDADGHSYDIRTNKGYTVRIESAYIGTATLELIPCRPTPSPARAALDFLSPPSALANHGYIHDTSLADAPRVESAVGDSSSEFGMAKGSGQPYCQLHELLAPLDAKAADGFHLDHWSAYLKGSYKSPTGAEHPFETHVNLRGGALVDLAATGTVTGNELEVRVVRSPAHAFDGADLDRLQSGEIAYAFLRGLTKGTRAEVSSR